jgi:O-antigen/teichoic acid export membrane protein
VESKHAFVQGHRPEAGLEGHFKGGSLLLLASVFGNGLNYLLMLFLTRQMGIDEFGTYAIGVTIFNTLLLLMTTGTDAGTVKVVSDRLALGGHVAARRMVMGVGLVAAAAGVAGAVGLALAAVPLAVGVYGKPGLASLLYLFAVALPFATVTGLLLSVLQAYRTIRSIVLVKYLWEPLGRWATALVAVAAGWGLAGVVGGLVATFVVSAALAAAMVDRVARVGSQEATEISRTDVRELATLCGPLLAANVFGVVAPRMDIMLLGHWASSADVGRYLIAFQTAAVLALVLGAFDVVFAPMMSRAWARHDEHALRDAYHAVHRMAGMTTVPVFVLVVVFRDEILAFFGGGTSDASVALTLLAIGYLLNAVLGGASTVLLMTGRSRTVLLNTILYGLALAFGAVLLIPRWGMVGAAVAAAAALVAVNVLRGCQVWQRHAMLPWDGLTWPVLTGGAAMAVGLSVAKSVMEPVWFVLVAATGMATYCAAVYVTQIANGEGVMGMIPFPRGWWRPARN